MSRILEDYSASLAPLGARKRTARVTEIELTPHTYLPLDEGREGWFPLLLRGLVAFRDRCSASGAAIQTFASIGVGAGLDVIAAHEVLGAKRVVVSDVHEDVTAAAVRNVRHNCPGLLAPDVIGLTGNLCSPLVAGGYLADAILENLPNLPASDSQVALGVRSASFFAADALDQVPAEISRIHLGLHFLFLQQAPSCLIDRGAVLCCIGARIPIPDILNVFRTAGFSAAPIAWGMVRQFEALAVLSEYARTEETGGEPFTFYPFIEGANVVRRLLGERVPLDAAHSQPEMQALRMSAREALELERSGTHTGHLGAVWEGHSDGRGTR